MSRLPLLPAALALVLYAGCAAFEATRLCQGTTESRMHTCMYCAHGSRWSCGELERRRD